MARLRWSFRKGEKSEIVVFRKIQPVEEEKEGINIMTREQFENNTGWKMTYEEFQKCDCTQYDKKDCLHRGAYRRVPRIDSGLCLCSNLKES